MDKLGSLYEAGSHGFKKFSSYDEHQALAGAAMRREVEAGFAETGDVAGLTAKYGELVLLRSRASSRTRMANKRSALFMT